MSNEFANNCECSTGKVNSGTETGNNLSAKDGLIGIERKIIMLEKLVKEINYVGRTNFKESQEFRRQRDMQFLIEVQNSYEKLFDDCYKLIRQVRRDLNE